MPNATATPVASVATLPHDVDVSKMVISVCHDCEIQIVDHAPRVFCDPCIALDDLERAGMRVQHVS